MTSAIASLGEMNEQSLAFLEGYLMSLSADQRSIIKGRQIIADFFCADAHNANLCASLTLNDEKRATCGLGLLYDLGQNDQMNVGDLLIVQNWDRMPVCIVEFTEIRRVPFKDVDADFARAEGEGDKSHSWWRKVHWAFFERELSELGKDMSEDAEIVTERFHRVWPR